MPDIQNDVVEEVDRSKLSALLNTIIVLIAVCAVFLVKAVIAGAAIRIVGLSFALLCCVMAYYYTRLKFRVVALTLVFSAKWVAITVAILTTGPLSGLTVSWLPISICLAGMLGGWRFCLRWSVLIFLTLLGLWLADAYLPIEKLVVEESKQWHAQMHIIAQLGVMFTCVMSFVKMNQRYEEKISEQNLNLIEEVEQRRRAEAVAVASAKAKTQFLANMSHEIRTPLNSVIGFSKRLITHAKLQDTREQEALRSIFRNGKGLMVLFNELLDFASLEEDSLQYSHRPFSLNVVAEECFEEASALANEYGLILKHSSVDSVEIQADRNRVSQIIKSLLYFSIRQTMEGNVELHVCQASRAHVAGALIIVSDTSPGIPPKQLASLFESHYEFVLNSNKELPISALSMVVAAKLVHMHGGEIDAKSEVGRGARFTVWLPATRPKATNHAD